MHRRDRIALGILAATVGFSALALGGAVRWAALGSALGALAAASIYLTSRRTGPISPITWLLAIAIAFTAFQLLPLPAALAELLAHAKLELLAENAQAFGEPAPRFVMASYDPPNTLVELAKLSGYAAAAFVATRIAGQKSGRHALAMMVASCATAVAVISIGHEIVGAEHVYGVFEPQRRHRLLSPVLNDNHFASLMSLGVPAGLCLALITTGTRRMLWMASSLVCAASGLIISSRGGAIGLLTGVGVTTIVLLLQRRQTTTTTRATRISWSKVTIVVCGTILLAVFAAGKVIDEIRDTDLQRLAQDPAYKFQAWRLSLPIIAENPWLGIGRGAFEGVFGRFDEGHVTAYSHVENTYLQAVIDWGIPGALALLVVGVFVGAAALRRWNRGPLEAGALGALASLALHELVDFSLEMPVVALVTILLLAMLIPSRGEPSPSDGPRLRPWIRCTLLASGLAICIVAGTRLGTHARNEVLPRAPAQQLEHARSALARHPSDYLLMGKFAHGLMAHGDSRAVPVIARALYLNPRHSGLHRLAAVMFFQFGYPAQAYGEIALAVKFAHWRELDEILDFIVTRLKPSEAARSLPVDNVVVGARVAQRLISRRQHELNFLYTSRLSLLHRTDATVQLLHAQAALRIDNGAAALPAARRAHALRPDVAASETLAKALALTGDHAGGVGVLRATQAYTSITSSERVAVLFTLFDIELEAGWFDAARSTLDELARLTSSKQDKINVHLRRARLHDRRGEHNQAKWVREQLGKLQEQ